MGADTFIATDEDADWASTHAGSLDLIVSTVSSPNLPLQQYLGLLDINGQFVQVGAPEDPIPQFNAFALILKNIKIGGSLIGSPREIREMLELAASTKTRAWVQTREMRDANQVLVDFSEGLPRYRYVLVN